MSERHPAVLAGRAQLELRKVWHCHCAKCGNRWTTSGEDLPESCSGCHMINWWIKRGRGRPKKHEGPPTSAARTAGREKPPARRR